MLSDFIDLIGIVCIVFILWLFSGFFLIFVIVKYKFVGNVVWYYIFVFCDMFGVLKRFIINIIIIFIIV